MVYRNNVKYICLLLFSYLRLVTKSIYLFYQYQFQFIMKLQHRKPPEKSMVDFKCNFACRKNVKKKIFHENFGNLFQEACVKRVVCHL